MDDDLGRFDDFVSQRLGALYRHAMALTGNPHDAEDLVQEALTRTGLAWRSIHRKDDPEGYVRVTMVRIMANKWRRPLREHPVAAPPETAASDHGLDRITDHAGLRDRLRNLPPRMRAVLVLRYVDELTDREIAHRMGCSLGTVRSQASRALAKLRTEERLGADHG